MKKLILIIFATILSLSSYAQCTIGGTTRLPVKLGYINACGINLQDLSDGLVKSVNDSLKTAMAGTDYQSPITNTLNFYDNFNRSNTSAGTISASPTGQSYTIQATGGNNARIESNMYVSNEGETVYAYVTTGVNVNRIGMKASFIPGTGVTGQSVAMAITSDGTINNMPIHFFSSNTSWKLQTRVGGGSFIDVATGTYPTALLLDGTVYDFEINIIDSTAYVFSAGMIATCNSSVFKTTPRSICFFEHFYAASTSNAISRIHETYAGAIAINPHCNIGYSSTNLSQIYAAGVNSTRQIYEGNISAPSWTTSGIRLIGRAGRLTNTTSSGTVTTITNSVFPADTLAANSSTTYTRASNVTFPNPIAGTNVTIGTRYCARFLGSVLFEGGTGITYLSGSGCNIGTQDAQSFSLKTSTTLRLTVSSAGLVGIGTTAPTPNSNLHVDGSFAVPYVSKTGTYTISSTDHTIDCTSGSFTVTLPTAASITGRIYVVTNTGAGTITLGTTSSQTINGSTTQTIAAGGGYSVQSNGSNWVCISKW